MDAALYQTLRSLLVAIDQQMSVIADEANRKHISAVAMKDSTGAYVLTPLLLAKAQTLNAMATLKG